VLRNELGFNGLIYTDSMTMDAVEKMLPPGEAAVRALKAGNDIILHSPDDAAAFDAMKKAVEGSGSRADHGVGHAHPSIQGRARVARQADGGSRAVAAKVGGRANRAVAQQVSERSITC
jgi:beta-glucosidase-like glycosyl hydrolase